MTHDSNQSPAPSACFPKQPFLVPLRHSILYLLFRSYSAHTTCKSSLLLFVFKVDLLSKFVYRKYLDSRGGPADTLASFPTFPLPSPGLGDTLNPRTILVTKIVTVLYRWRAFTYLCSPTPHAVGQAHHMTTAFQMRKLKAGRWSCLHSTPGLGPRASKEKAANGEAWGWKAQLGSI